MASIFDRLASIMKANVNDLIDKAEDPAKMIDQYLRELTDDLAEVREQTAAVMAEEKRAKRMLDDNAKDMRRYEDLAKKALSSGNESDARIFLQKKQEYVAKAETLQSTYDAAHESTQKMRAMHDKLVGDINTLNGRKEAVKAKVAVAKTQKKVNKVVGAASSKKADNALSAVARMEAKAEAMLGQAEAETELLADPVDAAVELERQYKAMGNTAAVDAELERLKAEMGM